ncbi:hypothetical protein [Haloarcula salinisoli]|uniref:Transcription factor n=1 Tax=Haloarcula salinisoli TaxID=2487746 RepID=A0A8J7YMC6_9EURY|nr:hypothetical protein [Halomicroarcula salinisoli]MBX0288026.1 hypothetical protein [Halomicroarcula salinisoli]MBX0305434.1 hypothetical protein [Halomicroarcula salinisoli]
MTSSESEAKTHFTEDGVEYTPHSMMHKAIVRMDPTKLEMLDGFERNESGFKFVPEGSNVRVMVNGRDWSEKRILVYGCTSTKEAEGYVETIIDRVTDIDHEITLVSGPDIANIAVSGDLGTQLDLERLSVEISQQGLDVEYEPEQFAAVIVRIEELSVTVLLFSTGKFSIQGLRSLDDIEPVITRIQSLIE